MKIVILNPKAKGLIGKYAFSGAEGQATLTINSAPDANSAQWNIQTSQIKAELVDTSETSITAEVKAAIDGTFEVIAGASAPSAILGIIFNLLKQICVTAASKVVRAHVLSNDGFEYKILGAVNSGGQLDRSSTVILKRAILTIEGVSTQEGDEVK
jgi:hypothetical protein